MGASYHVEGFVPPDDKFNQMRAVWDACHTAGIDPPQDVEEFFDGEPPDLAGVSIYLKGLACCTEYNDETHSWGFEVDLSLVPKNVKVIRFTISH